MNDYNPADYTFLGLCNNGKPLGMVSSLIYLISLVDSANHEVQDVAKAKSILSWMFDVEEQQDNASALLSLQNQFLSKGCYPQTPCMLTKRWSPIGAMLEQGFNPIKLRREPETRSVATGIWESFDFQSTKSIDDSKTVEELFWAILSETFRRAKERKMLVSIIAKPGWSYDLKIDSLPKWNKVEIAKADRILWKRTPDCP